MGQNIESLGLIFVKYEKGIAYCRVISEFIKNYQVKNSVIYKIGCLDLFLYNYSCKKRLQLFLKVLLAELFAVEPKAAVSVLNSTCICSVRCSCGNDLLFSDQFQHIIPCVPCVVIVERYNLRFIIALAQLIINGRHVLPERFENSVDCYFIGNPLAVGAVQRSEKSIILSRNIISVVFLSEPHLGNLLRHEASFYCPAGFFTGKAVISCFVSVNLPYPASCFSAGKAF